jgi:hypothetical protein
MTPPLAGNKTGGLNLLSPATSLARRSARPGHPGKPGPAPGGGHLGSGGLQGPAGGPWPPAKTDVGLAVLFAAGKGRKTALFRDLHLLFDEFANAVLATYQPDYSGESRKPCAGPVAGTRGVLMRLHEPTPDGTAPSACSVAAPATNLPFGSAPTTGASPDPKRIKNGFGRASSFLPITAWQIPLPFGCAAAVSPFAVQHHTDEGDVFLKLGLGASDVGVEELPDVGNLPPGELTDASDLNGDRVRPCAGELMGVGLQYDQ